MNGEEKGVIAYLALGSNLGDREANLSGAVSALGRLPVTTVQERSGIYITAPWGFTDQPDFLNMVISVRTGLQAPDLLKACKRIEREMGRVKGVRWGPRPIDIDILVYDSLEIHSETLVIPHAAMWDRAFVLRPLADIAPNLRGPNGKTVAERLTDEDIRSQEIHAHIETGK